MNFDAISEPLAALKDCCICPRNCHADRFAGATGYCRSGAGFSIASICIHRGEEPPVSGAEGICNVFFAHCNLQCVYCQNHQISDNRSIPDTFEMSLSQVVEAITAILDQGIRRVGFVSPSHFVPQVRVIIRAIESLGYRPVWVYNTNGYDKAETLRLFEGIIHVYLPDLKYMDPVLSRRYSGAEDYPEIAAAALREMFRQKGSALHLADDGTVESGIIVRHLVLPGAVRNSIGVLRFLAGELSPRLHLSLMSQYFPAGRAAKFEVLQRGVTREEYREVVAEMESLGMYRGWVQEFGSSHHYRPDFDLEHPFEG